MRLQAAFEQVTMIGQSRRVRGLAPVLLACSIFALGCAMRLPAALQHIEQGQAGARALDERQAALELQLADLDSLRATLTGTEQRLQEALWYMAAGQDMSDLVESIVASGRAHGLRIELLRVQEAQAQGEYQKVPLELLVTGEYAGVRQWLFDWLGQPRLLRSGDMSLIPASGQPGVLQLRLQVDAFQATAPTQPPQALAQLPASAPVAAPQVDPFRPQLDRLPVNGLVGAPLSQVRMVGTLSRAQAYEAVLTTGGKVYRVRLGDRVGRDQGVVTHIDAGQVEVREKWFMEGVWQERVAFLSLATRVGKEALVRDEQVMEMDTGNPAAAADGDSRPLSG